MHNEWEQFPPIEGDDNRSGMVIVYVLGAALFVAGFVAGALIF